MNVARKRKLTLVIFLLAVTMLTVLLATYALRQNISLFYTPSELVLGKAAGKKMIRVGGMVVKNSVQRGKEDDLSVTFELTDFNQAIQVSYRGILPDLFREGQGIVVMGEAVDDHHVKATEVLAKHDENYMPPEVKDAVAKGKKIQAGRS